MYNFIYIFFFNIVLIYSTFLAIYASIPASGIVNKLNIVSYNSACTIRTITVTVVPSIYSQSVRKPARGTRDNKSGQYFY